VVEVAVGLVGEVVREEVAEVGPGGVGLPEDAVPVLPGEGLLVAEAADAAERAEIMVEGPVLLHEDHHVLEVGDGPGQVRRQRLGRRRAGGRGRGGRPGADADGCGGGGAEPGRLQEAPSGDARHDRPAGLPR
jgi:hypothetical protein